MTDRIKRMQAALKVDKFPFCAEKAKLVIESWKKHEGLPAILSRAHATADYLDHRTIYVDEDELIVGNVASKPMGLEASCWGPFWDDDDLDSILEGNYTISDDRPILEFFASHRQDTPEALVHAVCTNSALWGLDLTTLPNLEKTVCQDLILIQQKGAYELMKKCLN